MLGSIGTITVYMVYHRRRVVHQVVFLGGFFELLSNRRNRGLKIDFRLGKVSCKVGITVGWEVSR